MTTGTSAFDRVRERRRRQAEERGGILAPVTTQPVPSAQPLAPAVQPSVAPIVPSNEVSPEDASIFEQYIGAPVRSFAGLVNRGLALKASAGHAELTQQFLDTDFVDPVTEQRTGEFISRLGRADDVFKELILQGSAISGAARAMNPEFTEMIREAQPITQQLRDFELGDPETGILGTARSIQADFEERPLGVQLGAGILIPGPDDLALLGIGAVASRSLKAVKVLSKTADAADVIGDSVRAIPSSPQLAHRPTFQQANEGLARLRQGARSDPVFRDLVESPEFITTPGREFTIDELRSAGGGIRGRGFEDDAIRQRNQLISVQDATEFSENELSGQLRAARQRLENDGPGSLVDDTGSGNALEDFIIQVTDIDDPKAIPFQSLLDRITEASESASRRAVRAAQRRDELKLDAEADAIERGIGAIGRREPDIRERSLIGASQPGPGPIGEQAIAERARARRASEPQTVRQPIPGASGLSVEFRPPRHIDVGGLPLTRAQAAGRGQAARNTREAAEKRVDARLAAQDRAKNSPLVKRATQAIRDTKIVRDVATKAISTQRGQRTALGAAAQQGGDVRSRSGRFFGAQGGEFDIPTPGNAISELFTPAEFDELVLMIRDPAIFNQRSEIFQMNTADQAFQKLFEKNLLPTEGEFLLLERVFGKEFMRTVRRKRSLGKRGGDALLDIWNLPRSVLAAGDISGSLRQAVIAAPGNPRQWLDANGAQIRAALSERNFLIEEDLIRSNPNFERYTRKPNKRRDRRNRGQTRPRLHQTSTSESAPFSAREEQFASSLADSIPLVKQSQRAFVTLTNKLRMDVMDKMVKSIERGGVEATEKQLDSIANYVNNLTGRGPLPLPEDVAALLNGIFFSSRLFTSRIALPFSLITKSPGVRTKMAKDLVAAFGGVVTALALLDLSGVAEVEMDPRSSDFGRIKSGKQRLDVWAGYQPIARFIAQFAMGETKSTGSGAISEADRVKLVYNFVRSKLHPSAGQVVTQVVGTDFVGRPAAEFEDFLEPFGDEADIERNPIFQNFTFLFVQDIVEALAEDGTFSAFKAGVAGISGLGVNTYTTVDDVARDVFNDAPFSEIYPFEQTEARVIFNAEEDEIPEELPNGDINPDLPRGRFLDIERGRQLTELEGIIRKGSKEERSTVVRQYIDIKREHAIRKSEDREARFGDTDFEQPSLGAPGQHAALEEYYALFDEDTSPVFSPAGRFLVNVYLTQLQALEAKWKRQGTLLYVQANTNTKPVPSALREYFKDHYKSEFKRINESERARKLLTVRARGKDFSTGGGSVPEPTSEVPEETSFDRVRSRREALR